jgi:hypothetical protein
MGESSVEFAESWSRCLPEEVPAVGTIRVGIVLTPAHLCESFRNDRWRPIYHEFPFHFNYLLMKKGKLRVKRPRTPGNEINSLIN